jgi:hypothetical protein
LQPRQSFVTLLHFTPSSIVYLDLLLHHAELLLFFSLAEPTGFNPGFGQSPFGNGVAPQSSSGPAQKDTNPVNVFAAMKAGTFANDSAPQSAGEAFLRAVGGRAS